MHEDQRAELIKEIQALPEPWKNYLIHRLTGVRAEEYTQQGPEVETRLVEEMDREDRITQMDFELESISLLMAAL